MKNALSQLKGELANFNEVPSLPRAAWSKMAENTTVVLMAGGLGLRFAEVTGNSTKNKNAHLLPNGKTIIEMSLEMYKQAGITKFVGLLYHGAEEIERILGDGSKYGVEIKYSYDPGPVGKGGALKHAYENNSLPNDHYIIIQNPDDVFTYFSKKFTKHIMAAHAHGENERCFATIVVVDEMPYAYTGMVIKKSKVTQIEMYPMIPIPTHVGTTILSPGLKHYFVKNFNYAKKEDFEKKLFPILARQGYLYSVNIPSDCWIPVNNKKSYDSFVNYLEETNSDLQTN